MAWIHWYCSECGEWYWSTTRSPCPGCGGYPDEGYTQDEEGD